MRAMTVEEMPRDRYGRVALTARQLRVLVVISELTKAHGYAPTIRELQAAIKARSPNAVAQKLKYLRRKGWVTWEPKQARTLRINAPAARFA